MAIINENKGILIGAQVGDTYTIHNESKIDGLSELLSQIQSAMEQEDITPEERREANECFDVIKEEARKSNPRKKFMKIACNGLKNIVSNPAFWELIDRLPLYIPMIQK